MTPRTGTTRCRWRRAAAPTSAPSTSTAPRDGSASRPRSAEDRSGRSSGRPAPGWSSSSSPPTWTAPRPISSTSPGPRRRSTGTSGTSSTAGGSLPAGARPTRSLGEQVRLLGEDPVVERLRLEPAGAVAADLARGLLGLIRIDEHRITGRFGEQLHLAGALHRDEPPHGLVDAAPDGQQSVVGEDDRLALAERLGDALALLELEHRAGVVVEDGVVAVERAGVLGERVERSAQGGPRL